MKKYVISAIFLVLLFTGGQAFGFGEEVAKEAIKAAASVAKAAINKNKSEVDLKNSDIKNKVELKEAVNVGNSGVEIKADKVKLDNSDLTNEVKMRKALNYGNSGISVGQD